MPNATPKGCVENEPADQPRPRRRDRAAALTFPKASKPGQVNPSTSP
jgi:hypothetical protein